MNRETLIANENNYGNMRSITDIDYIVVHYTGNDGDKAINNAKYFKNNIVKASSHYFVDDDTIVQSVPDNYVAYGCGDRKYSNTNSTGGGKYYGICKNANSLNVEMCDTLKNGTVMVTEKTICNTITLIKELMKKYNIDDSCVIRHFDVSGKQCPAYYCYSEANDKKWADFKKRLNTVNSVNVVTTVKTESVAKESEYNMKTIKLNSKCKVVKVWQIIIGVNPDGIFGVITDKYTKAYQRAHGLDDDGIVGKLTWAEGLNNL